MHDSRACGLITRVLRTIVPEFSGSSIIAVEIREFISTDVFRACITSLHDPYFVDIQSDLASLVGNIITEYCNLSDTPAQLLCSLPGVPEEAVLKTIEKLSNKNNTSRQQRAIVLKLLEGLRGVSISEQGKFPRLDPKKARSALQEKYMTTEVKSVAPVKRESPDLGGVADMFA